LNILFKGSGVVSWGGIGLKEVVNTILGIVFVRALSDEALVTID